MKFLRLCLVLTAAGLVFANWHVRRGHNSPNQSTVQTETADIATSAPVQSPAVIQTTAIVSNITKLPQRAFNWTNIETTDYKQYVAQLRSVGFPEELVRTILIADVNKLYEARESALKLTLMPYDAPMDKRQTHDITDDDWQHIKQLRDQRVEKQAALMEILGAYVPREILRTPISRNYESYEYAISLLPEEKRDAVQTAQETEIFSEAYNKTHITDHAAELESFKRTRQERDAAMLKILTPEEFEQYELNTTPAGTELARRVIGMDPTDDEFATMFRIAYTNWLDTGGVYGRWRAQPVPADQIAAADQQMDASMKDALGSGRYLDYKMAISGTGQQLRNMAARYALPSETISQAFALQTEIDQLSRAMKATLQANAVNLNTGPPDPAERISQLQEKLAQTFGPELWQAWQAGRNLRVDLSP
ncbi:MAG TPA: hypothetical protein VLT36_19665 [Candidatus Dormibacteraeota bacterium]|nr:hypothetical protein [Candidatus Dormibacteraeota bacterium]